MGIYNSRGFNWKQYEEIPEKTNVVWFRNDPYTEITFREFVRIIDLFFPLNKTSEDDNTPVEDVQPILPPTNANKKITEITDEGLMQKLKPLLAINSPHTLEAIKLVQSHYGNIPTMKFRDWAKLVKTVKFDNSNQSEYITTEEKPIELVAEDTFVMESPSDDEQHKKKNTILKVTYPDGRVVAEKVVIKTLLDVILNRTSRTGKCDLNEITLTQRLCTMIRKRSELPNVSYTQPLATIEIVKV